MDVNIITNINCSINLNDLNRYLNNIEWNNVNKNDILHYSSNTNKDFINFRVMKINKNYFNKEVYLKTIR